MRSSFITSFAAISLGSKLASAQCQVYGIDFVSGGSYFQNASSTDPFTAVQEFSGCDNDVANNIFIDPSGDEFQCSDTPLTPDYSPETITCADWPKNKLYSGDWSLIIISNNGNAEPIAFQRDFQLDVGVPSTSTFTPTVTQTDVETSISSIFSTTTSIITTTLVASTSTKRALIAWPNPNLTSQPLNVQTITKDLFTVTHTKYVPIATATVMAVQASCAAPKPNWIADPVAKIQVTIIKSLFQTINPNSAKFKRASLDLVDSKKRFVAERSARLASANKFDKRAPDNSLVTVTATTGFITATSTQFSTLTSTIPTTALVTSTVTPAVVTVTQALIDLARLQTEILAALHFTVVQWDVATQWQTKSVPWTVTVTRTTTPADVAAACTGTGGRLIQ